MLKKLISLFILLLVISIGCKNQGRIEHRLLYQGYITKSLEQPTDNSEPMLSPDKSKFLDELHSFDKNENITYSYVVKDLKTDQAKIIFSFTNKNGEPSDETPRIYTTYAWQPNNKFVTFIVRTWNGKEIEIKILNINVDTAKIESLNAPKLITFCSKYDNWPIRIKWAPDRDKLGVVLESHSADLHVDKLFEYDFDNDKLSNIYTTPDHYHLGDWAWSSNSKKIALSIWEYHGEIGGVDLDTGSIHLQERRKGAFKQILHDKRKVKSYDLKEWSPDGNWMLLKIYDVKIQQKTQGIFNLLTKDIYALHLPNKLKGETLLGWSKDGKDLLVGNKEGIWSLDFASIPKQKTSM